MRRESGIETMAGFIYEKSHYNVYPRIEEIGYPEIDILPKIIHKRIVNSIFRKKIIVYIFLNKNHSFLQCKNVSFIGNVICSFRKVSPAFLNAYG